MFNNLIDYQTLTIMRMDKTYKNNTLSLFIYFFCKKHQVSLNDHVYSIIIFIPTQYQFLRIYNMYYETYRVKLN